MRWIALLVGSTAIYLIGAYLFRSGRVKVVKLYMAITAVLFAVYFMNFALLLGAKFLWLPLYLLIAFLPGTFVLMLRAIKRDREDVMGRPEDREAATTGAVVYGAGSYAEGGDLGGGTGTQ